MNKKVNTVLAIVVVVVALAGGYMLGRRGTGPVQSGSVSEEVKKVDREHGKDVPRNRKPRKLGVDVRKVNSRDDVGDVSLPAVKPGNIAEVQTKDADGPIPVRGDIRDFVMEEYTRFNASGDAVDPKFLEQIRSCGDRTVLATLTDMIRNGATREEKKSGLFALAVAYGRGNPTDGDVLSQAVGVSQTGQPSPDEKAEENARRIHDVVVATGAGLKDPEAAVREAAYATMTALGEEEQNALVAQIFAGEDSDLKLKLVADTSGSTNERDVMTSIGALDNSDAATVKAAQDNLKSVLGQSFKTQDEALAWWEKNRENFLSQQNGGTTEPSL